MAVSLGELAKYLGAELYGDAGILVDRVSTLSNALPGHLSFLSNRRYIKLLGETRASAVILAAEHRDLCPAATLVMDNPYLGYARAASRLNPTSDAVPGIHPSAAVSPEASIDETAHVGPNAVVEGDARIGPGASIGPGSVVRSSTRVGRDSMLVAMVTLCSKVRIGDRALIHPGVVIGADGFGIANDGGVWVKVPQLGGVRIGDDVEIGSNTTIDRGALEDTVLEDGVKIDNQVQIGHNVHIGANTAIAGCVAIAGSVKIGRRCTISGSSSIAGHLEIVDDVHLTGASQVPSSIKKPGVYSSGMPVQDNRLWRRNIARFRQLDELARRVKALEQDVE